MDLFCGYSLCLVAFELVVAAWLGWLLVWGGLSVCLIDLLYVSVLALIVLVELVLLL